MGLLLTVPSNLKGEVNGVVLGHKVADFGVFEGFLIPKALIFVPVSVLLVVLHAAIEDKLAQRACFEGVFVADLASELGAPVDVGVDGAGF